MRPICEGTTAVDYFFRQEFGCPFVRRRVELGAVKNKIPKKKISFLLNPPGYRIKKDLFQRSKIGWEKFAKPFFTHAGDLGEENNQFVIPPLDFANLASDKERTFLHYAFPSENAMSSVDEIAAKCSGIDALRQMIGKPDQHAFSERFGVELIDFFFDVQPFVSGNFNELFKDRRDLLGDGVANTKPAGLIRAMLLSVKPCSNQHEKI